MAKKIKPEDLFESDIFQDPTNSAKTLLNVLGMIRDELKGLSTDIKNSLGKNDITTTKDVKELSDNLEQLAVVEKEYSKIIEKEAKLQAQLKAAEEGRTKGVDELNERLKAQRAINRQQAKEAAGLTSEYQKQSRRLKELRDEYKDLALQNKENTKEGRELLANITQLDTKLKGVDKTVGQSQRNVGNYTQVVEKLRFGFFAVVGVVTSVIAAITSFGQKVGETQKRISDTQQLFKVTRQEATGLAKDISGVAAAFDQDFNEVLLASNALSKQFEISGTEAISLINEGFEKGANINGDFLAQLQEYPAQFDAVGLSASESIALIQQQVSSGIFSDKGIDTIKEAGLRLRELTPATRDALDAIGISSDQIAEDLESGSRTIFDVIQEVSAQLDKLPPQSAVVGTAIADIFGGAGEDAGLEYIKTLADINTNLEEIEDTSSIYEKTQRELAKSWDELSFSATKGGGIITDILAGINQGAIDFLNTLKNINEEGFFGGIIASDPQFQAFQANVDEVVRLTIEAGEGSDKFREGVARLNQQLAQIEELKLKAFAEGDGLGFAALEQQAQSLVEAIDKVQPALRKVGRGDTRDGGVEIEAITDPEDAEKARQDELRRLLDALDDELALRKKANIEQIDDDEELKEAQLQVEAEFLQRRINILNDFGERTASFELQLATKIDTIKDDAFKRELQRQQELLEATTNRVNTINDIEQEQLNQQIFLTQRLIEDEKERIALLRDAGEEVDTGDLEALIQKEFDLRKRQLEDAADFRIQTEELTDEEIELIRTKLNNDLERLELERLDTIEDINDEILKAEEELNAKRLEEQRKAAEELLRELAEQAKRRSELREQAVDEELDLAKDREKHLRDLATRGSLEAQQSLAAEQKRIAELEQQKLEEQQQRQRIEAGLAAFELLSEKIANGEPRPVASTIADILRLVGFIDELPGFAEGTEYVPLNGAPKGTDTVIARVNEGERIIDTDRNKRIGNMSNEQLTQLAEGRTNPVMFESATNADNYFHQYQSTQQILAKFDELKKAVEDRPVDMGWHVDELTKLVTHIVKEQGRVERNHYTKGLRF